MSQIIPGQVRAVILSNRSSMKNVAWNLFRRCWGGLCAYNRTKPVKHSTFDRILLRQENHNGHFAYQLRCSGSQINHWAAYMLLLHTTGQTIAFLQLMRLCCILSSWRFVLLFWFKYSCRISIDINALTRTLGGQCLAYRIWAKARAVPSNAFFQKSITPTRSQMLSRSEDRQDTW